MRGSQDLILQVGSTRSLQFLPNRYNLFYKVGPKLYIFPVKNVFIRVFDILVISHPF